MDVAPEFVRVAQESLRQGADRVQQCLARLDQDQIWHRDHEIENSIGNLVLHLCGNVRQWIVCGVGGEQDRRNRDWEFATRDALPAEDLARRLAETVEEAESVLAGLASARLLETRRIQVYEVTVLHAVIHVLTHFSGHVGQIIWATKHFTGRDLGFYGYLRKGSDPGEHSP